MDLVATALVERTRVSDEEPGSGEFIASAQCRRDYVVQVLVSKSAFAEAGCAGCHTPKFVTDAGCATA
jgi:hypothetical protein